MLRESSVVVRTRPRAIPLPIITMRKSIHGFLLVPYMGMGLRLAAALRYQACKLKACTQNLLSYVLSIKEETKAALATTNI